MDHDGNCGKVCIVCTGKSGGLLLNDTLKDIFIRHIYSKIGNFEEDEEYLPKGICEGCARKLRSLDSPKPRSLGILPNYQAMVANIKKHFDTPRTRSSGEFDPFACDCEYCLIGRSLQKIFSQFASQEKRKRGRSIERPQPGPSQPNVPTPSTSGSSSSSSSGSKSGSSEKPRCFHCGQIKAPGHPHQCGRTGKLQAMWEIASPKTRDMFTARHLKDKFQEAKEAGTEGLVSLSSRFGRPLEIKAKNAKEKSIMITREMLDQFRLQMDIGKKKTLEASRFFKNITGATMEPYMQEYIMSTETCLSDFFEIREINWIVYEREPDDTKPISKQKLVKKTIKIEALICTDIEGLKFFLLMERVLDENVITKVGKF